MKSPRLVAVATLSSVLLLAACSDTEDPAEAPTTGPTAPDGVQESSAGGDDASATSAPADTDGATATAAPEPEEPQTQAALEVEEAEQVAADLLATAVEAAGSDGEEARAIARGAYSGPAIEAFSASDVLEPVVEASNRVVDREPTVLAISRADQPGPPLVLVQTVPEEGLPVLYLMAGQDGDGAEDFRIVWTAPMLPGTAVGEFDRRTVGSPVQDGAEQGDLRNAPTVALDSLAAALDYPTGRPTSVRTNSYGPTVRDSAATQAQEVNVQATFAESNTVNPTYQYSLVQADGSVLTFGVLNRSTTFDVREGMELIAPAPFTAFTDTTSLTSSATLDTRIFVAVHVPTQEAGGTPSLIAARDQLVGAEGS